MFILNDINFYHIFKYDLLKSNSKVLIDTMIFERKLSNFFRINTQIREILYLLEYQPWEMVLNKVVSKKKIKTKGILFSIFRPNLFQFYHSKLIHPYMYNPNYIGVNSPSAKKIFNQNGFKNSQILKIEAQRYTYLDSLKNINCNSNNQKIIDSIIIATSIDPLETLKLLEIFAFSKIQFKKIYIREHPHLRVNSIIKSLNVKFPKYELINGSLYENFNLTDIVYCANSSSILFDSIFSSKHTITLITLTSIPNLAIKKADNLYFIYNSKNLNCILNNIKFKYIDKNKSKKNVKDLYLSNNNKNWLNFLNK